MTALFFAAFQLVAGCSRSTQEGILDKDQMAELIMDLYLKEARMKEASDITTDSSVLLFTHLRRQYATSHRFPDSLIDASFAWYLDRPREMDEVYDRVIDSLSLREQRIGPTQEPPGP